MGTLRNETVPHLNYYIIVATYWNLFVTFSNEWTQNDKTEVYDLIVFKTQQSMFEEYIDCW